MPVPARVLVEEVEKRTGIRLPLSDTGSGPLISISSGAKLPAEGFHLRADSQSIRIEGADARGALYGVGYLLRHVQWGQGKLTIAAMDITSAPQSRIRGHQLGYRTTANSWDAWTIPQYEQYIRDLALFGVNAIENIPFQDDRLNPLMKVPRRQMNRAIAEICQRYGLEHWVWTPAPFDLNDQAKRAALLASFDEFFRDVPTLSGVFFPGGDPGSNPPELVLSFLEEVARHMKPVHPQAKIWLSLQGFHGDKAEVVYKFLDRQVPAWFGGIVHGPSSPSIESTRSRLPASVALRLYPDVTHNKLSQYEVPQWDQAYALTLGREAVNPRPYEYAAIHNRYAALSDGFISYSDGVHDDVNKVLWSSLAWDRTQNVRDILIEYCSYHFSSEHAAAAADGLLALERNWRGSLEANGAVEGTLLYWQGLEARLPQLAGNWRWQMHVLRAVYDAYVRRRLLQDTALENEANAILLDASKQGPERAMTEAQTVLNRAVQSPAGADLRARIIDLCAKLFDSIGLQTSVEKYHASGAERGAVLDFIDNPLNNRWWLEDEFARVRKLGSRDAQLARLREIAMWEHPGPGSFYDNPGNIAKSPHLVRGEGEDMEPLFWWWDQGKSRARLSWQVTMWPKAMEYTGLDPKARYVVRTTGYGQALLRIDGQRVTPTIDGRETADFKEFPVPAEALKDGKLELTWDPATDERHLNWRQRSRLAEVWVLKR